MTLLSDVISDCRNRYLLTGRRESRNKLAGSVDASTTAFAFTYELEGIETGAKVAVELEDVGIWDVSTGSQNATVQRGDFGSTAAAHTAGTIVSVNPRFSNFDILHAVNQELAALSSRANGLYRMRPVDLTDNPAVDGYDLTGTSGVLSIWQLRYKSVGPAREWPLITKYDFQRDLPADEFASGSAVFVREYAQPGNPIRVWYRTGFSPLTALTDDVTAVSGLHAEAHDLLSIGAAVRLTVGREVSRNFDESQGDTRRAGEVPPGANLGANRWLQQYRMQRIREEAARLAELYPKVW